MIDREPKKADILGLPELLRSIGQEDIVVEGGAHFGESTYYLSLRAKLVYAFEPEALSFRVLKAYAKRWPNVIPIKKGLGDRDTSSFLRLLEKNRASRSSSVRGNFGKDYSKKERIELTSIDSYKTKATVLILDVEGEELSALKGAEKTLQTLNRVYVETHKLSDGQDTADGVRQKLLEKGFKIREHRDRGNLLWIFGSRFPF